MNDEAGYLEKIDVLRARTGLGFSSARNLLEETNWDLLEALTRWDSKETSREKQLFNRIKDIITQGTNTRILVKTQEDTVAELPVTVGVLGAVLAPKLALLGAAACLLTRCSLQLKKVRDPDTAENSGLIDN